ncbi:MAG: Gfo/Idh/MocA family oxidoreductase [Planctomycetes bacterium]|nr:Gfo/Idh/MocA family oxidoreductase [Planctomycetota bacterium]
MARSRKKKTVKVGVIGCGDISGIYFKNMVGVFEVLDVVACADLIMSRARAKAREFKGVKAVTVKQLLADRSIDIVVNLTVPRAHYEVAMAAVKSGKSVYNEKPLSVTREQGAKLLDAAGKKGVLVGGAPDTFLGAGIQTCRKLIDDGWIGDPIAATAFFTCAGHERWHPNPEFYYKPGGGPMFDMGPYYITALVALMGPVRRVTGSAAMTRAERMITSAPKRGKMIKVEVPTHVAGVLDFACGAIATIITSFDVWAANLPRIEIYGTAGSLSVPDPNRFGGPVLLQGSRAKEWSEMALSHPYSEDSRGLGVADMAAALLSGRPHRASGELCMHALDVMQSIHEASARGRHVKLTTTCKTPAPMPTDLLSGCVEP